MWEIAHAQVGTVLLQTYLNEGWEPFAVSPNPQGKADKPDLLVIWLKRYRER